MNAIQIEQTARPSDRAMSAPVLRTLLVCDLAESTALIERLGDRRAAELMRRQDRIARDLMQRHGGREIDKTDGFLLLFDRPIHAVAFALEYQRQLRQLGRADSPPLEARIGIHVGDVVLWENDADDIARGAKPLEVEGIVKPTVARLMGIARPGQILLSGVAHTLAERARPELATEYVLRWCAHGNYRFKGVPEPVAVYEVGEDGVAPFKPPSWSGKAHRELPWWRRPATLIVEALAAVLLIAVPLYFSVRSAPALAFAKRDWVVVGDFKNLTGESIFDDSMQSAFRIGMEESRYVNVLPDLKVRDAIKRMQRDPENTRLDRVVGSEVAIREGARALILPTLAEVGGRVRVTAEVIDPNTQTTVYSESADGIGEASVLPSLDKVNQQLRVRLGEALTTVSNESHPLSKVATGNLEALKLFALAQAAYGSSKDGEAMELYRQAIKLDPDFALAHVALARTLRQGGDDVAALNELKLSEKLTDRLIPREKRYAEAWAATIGESPRVAMEKWKLMSNLYPDFFSGQGMYPYLAWLKANRFDTEIIDSAKDAAGVRNPNPSSVEVLLGSLNLGNERYADAAHYNELAENDWHFSRTAEFATVFAAQRQFDKADEVAARGKPAGVPGYDIGVRTAEIAMSLDRGDWAKAWNTLANANQEALKVGTLRQLEFRETELSLQSFNGTLGDKNALRNYIGSTVNTLTKAAAFDRSEIQNYLLGAAYLAAREGDAKLASDVLAKLGPEPTSGDYPVLGNLLTIVQAQCALSRGDAAESARLLTPLLNGDELALTHLVLLDAYAASGNKAAAVAQAQWLAIHRGRAYAEYAANSFIPFNVAQTNLAQLRSAELYLDLGDKTQARRSLDAFRKFWPQAETNPAFSSRVSAVVAAL